MKAVSIIFIFCTIVTSGILLDCIDQTLDEKPADYEDLRVSENQFAIPMNYHTIIPGDHWKRERKSFEHLTNHIGRPLVPLPQKSTTQKFAITTPASSQSKRQQQRFYSANPTTANPLSKTQVNPPAQLESKSKPTAECHWMPLRDFKSVSLDKNELIIRDEEEQPCYLLSMRAYFKGNEDAFFPLKNFRVYPNANKVIYNQPTEGASERLPFNCSIMVDSEDGVKNLLLPIQRANRLFREEITVFVDCGYLILHIYGYGSFLSLEALSFYQSSDVIQELPYGRLNREQNLRTSPEMRSEHLVFSSEGTQNYPLFTIPMTSRYLCQNRVVLTGNNSIQLVLDRFELQRLSSSSSMEFKDPPSLSEIGINASKQSSVVTNKKSINRETTSSKIPVSSVMRCPNPIAPTTHLTYMMDFGLKVHNDKLRKSVADRWVPSRSSASQLRGNFLGMNIEVGGYLSMFTHLLTLCLVRYILRYIMVMSTCRYELH